MLVEVIGCNQNVSGLKSIYVIKESSKSCSFFLFIAVVSLRPNHSFWPFTLTFMIGLPTVTSLPTRLAYLYVACRFDCFALLFIALLRSFWDLKYGPYKRTFNAVRRQFATSRSFSSGLKLKSLSASSVYSCFSLYISFAYLMLSSGADSLTYFHVAFPDLISLSKGCSGFPVGFKCLRSSFRYAFFTWFILWFTLLLSFWVLANSSIDMNIVSSYLISSTSSLSLEDHLLPLLGSASLSVCSYSLSSSFF